jgi:hypothetical protein
MVGVNGDHHTGGCGDDQGLSHSPPPPPNATVILDLVLVEKD